MHLTLLVMSLMTSWTWVVMVIGTSSDLLGVVPSSMSVNLNGASDHEMIRAQSLDSSEGLSTPALIAISNTAFLTTQSSSILHVVDNTVLSSSINPTMSSQLREITSSSSSAPPGTDQDLNSVRYQSSKIVTLATPMESAMTMSSEATHSTMHSTIQIKESLTPDPTPSLKSFTSNQLHEDSVSSSLFKTDVLSPSFSEFSSTSRMGLSLYHTSESEMIFSVHLKTPSLFTSIIDDQMQTDLSSDIGVTLDNSLLYNQSRTFVTTTDYLSSVSSQPPKFITQVDDAVAMATSTHSLITRTIEQSLYATLVSGMMNQIASTDSFLHLSTIQYEEVQSTYHVSKLSRVMEMTPSVLFSSHPNASRENPSVATMMSHSSNHMETPSLSLLTQGSMDSYLTVTKELNDQLQSSSRKLLEHSQSISNETSGVVMATGTSTVLMSTLSVSTYPTLDQSFSTRPFWLTLDVIVPEDIDITTEDFITTMELNLAVAYTEGKTRRDEREASVIDLLERLNPDNDPLLNRRKKRAMTVNGNTAQVIDISRHLTYAVNVVMVFYIAVESGSIPAVESKAIFDELTLQELTFYLGVVVETNPTEVIPPDVMTTPSAPASNYVWIIPVVIGLSGFLFLVCCCCFCICCRRPVKTSRDGPMDMDTLKMLQHKQKYPYKPYKTPNETPRGFDVAKETDVNNEAADGTEPGAGSSGMKLHHSSTASAIRNQLRDTRLDIDTVSSSSSDSLSTPVHGGPVVPPLQLQNVQDTSPKKSTEDKEEVVHKDVSSVEMSSRSRPSSRSHVSHVGGTQPRLLPLRTRMTQDVDQRSKSATSSPRSPFTTSKEGAEFKRLYQEAQNEISQILNPDVTSNPPDLIHISPDKRRSKKGKSSKREHVEQETKFDSGERGQIQPDTNYAMRSAKQQMTSSKRHPEALSEARRRVHHLIDEAFSLVGLTKNVVSPVTPLATDEEKSTADNKLFMKDKDAAFGEGSLSTMKDIKTFITEHQDRKQTKKEEAADGGTRVLVVPVTHVPNKTSDVVWNPYHAEDKLNQLQQSQQLTSSVAGRVEMKYKPDEASHLNMPDPLSVTTPSHEPWMKRLSTPRNTDQEQALNQRTHSDGRHLTDVDTTQFDDPYLDPYLKKSSQNDLSGSVNLPEYPNAASEEDPYTMRIPRVKKHDASSNPDRKQGDMLSTIAMERRVGKPITDGYDEIDVSRAAKSTNLQAALRDELTRLAKKIDQNDSNV